MYKYQNGRYGIQFLTFNFNATFQVLQKLPKSSMEKIQIIKMWYCTVEFISLLLFEYSLVGATFICLLQFVIADVKKNIDCLLVLKEVVLHAMYLVFVNAREAILCCFSSFSSSVNMTLWCFLKMKFLMKLLRYHDKKLEENRQL